MSLAMASGGAVTYRDLCAMRLSEVEAVGEAVGYVLERRSQALQKTLTEGGRR